MRIGIIGPSDTGLTILNIAKKLYPNINIDFLEYHKHAEIEEIISAKQEVYDAFVFSGPFPYAIAQKKCRRKNYWDFVPRNGTSLYRTLFNILYHKRLNLENISIDSVEKSYIEETFKELSIPCKEMFVKELGNYHSNEEIFDFHWHIYQEKKTNIFITGLYEPYLKLKDKNVNVFRLTPTASLIRNTLQRVVLGGELTWSKAAQIAVMAIQADSLQKEKIYLSSSYSFQKLRINIFRKLLEFAEQLQSSLFLEEDKYILFSTRGILENKTNNLKNFSIIQNIYHSLPVTVSVGIGFGITANEAKNHAQVGICQAQKYKGNCSFLVYENSKIKGPLIGDYQSEYSLKTTDKKIQDISQKTGLSVLTISKIKGMIQEIKRNEITANELAEYYGITLRSARRILVTLLKSNQTKIIGREQPEKQGRPRKIYKINF
ncbi:MAG TPA: hypothetical protein DCK79_07345 [Candidatus Atribacteria bacterium]|nr:hypothetical protein [Candidatus Atribacteria bacterium]